MKKFLTILSILLLAACTKEPERVERVNTEFTVDRLFTVDGCTVYRFRDSSLHYFTNCKGMTMDTRSCGKSCSREEEIGGGQ